MGLRLVCEEQSVGFVWFSGFKTDFNYNVGNEAVAKSGLKGALRLGFGLLTSGWTGL